MTFFAAVLVASFGYLLTNSTPVFAAEGTWDGDNISYDGKTFKPIDTPASLRAQLNDPQMYEYAEPADGINARNVYYIYFPNGVAPKSEGEATYVVYTIQPPGTDITGQRDKQTIILNPVDAVDGANTDDGALASECTVDGIGWIVCPIMNGIAEGMDFIYERIQGFLKVQPISTSVDNPVYRVWVYSRDLANILFIIGFLVIIYSYVVGGGFSGYEIRKILPRLVIAAILINLSYIICSVAVDISNIAGYGVNQMFEIVREDALTGSNGGDGSEGINWTSTTTLVLAGGAGAIAGKTAIAASIGGIGGLWMLLAPFLFGAALLVIVTFFILAARQAIIVIAIAIAPLAFAALILPNTEKWFEKWRTTFFSMLVMFPAFGAVFGGAQLAGETIIRAAAANGSIEQIILGLGVMVAPLAITPLLLRLGGGLLNRFGGIVNNPQKGIYDRFKNHTNERRAEYLAGKNKENAALLASGGFKRGQFIRKSAAKSYAKKNFRTTKRERDEERAKHIWEGQTGRWGGENSQSVQSRITGRPKEGYGNLDTYRRDNDLRHKAHEAHSSKKYEKLTYNDPERRAILTGTRFDERVGKSYQERIAAQDDRTINTAINKDAAYADIRGLEVQSKVDSGVAEKHKASIDASGKLALNRTIKDSRELSRVAKDTLHSNKQAEIYETIVQKAAEKSWSDRVRNDAAVQTLYVESKRNEDGAQLAEQQVKTFVQEIRAKGSATPNLAVSAQSYADNIKELVQQTDVAKNAEAAAQSKERTNLAVAYKASAELRMKAGGIGGEAAANLVYAKAFQTMVNDQVEGTKAEKTILGQVDSDEIFNRMDNPDASVEQLAAYAGTIAGRGFHAHHIKLLGKISRMYQGAVASGDEDQVAKMKDMIQQAGGDMSKTAFGVRDFDRTLLSEGRYDANIYQTTRERILTNLSPEVMANMDPDDIHLIYEMHRKGFLTDEQSQKIRDEWEKWQNNNILSSKIQAKHRNFFDRIKNEDYSSQIGGMSAPPANKYGITDQDFGPMPPDVQLG